MTRNPDIRAAALWYAEHGIPVFPCKPRGKEPLTPHGFKDATTDRGQVTQWWERWPDANVAIPTGAASGFLVVDVDPRNGGPVDRVGLVELHGPIPETAEIITGSGGRHFYFRYGGGAVVKTLSKGIDLKGGGGYVLAPPSIHPNGQRYEVDGIGGEKAFLQIADAPVWLLDRAAKHVSSPAEPVPNSAKWASGERNSRLTSLAGAMRRHGANRQTIVAALRQANCGSCDPSLSENEVLRIAESVARYDPGGVARTGDASQGSYKLTLLADLLKEPEESRDWILEGILPAGGLSLLIGKPKAGKSTLARCLALAVSRGEPFLGKNTTPGPVLYLALEEKRSELRKHFQDLGATGKEPIFIHAERAPDQAVAEARKIIEQHRSILVIIDPLLKFARVKDANDYAQVNAALEPLLALARETGTHVLLLYHAGKAGAVDPVDAALGSTAFSAGVDTQLILRRTEDYRTLQTVQRYGADLPETILTFDNGRRAVSLGVRKEKAESARIGDRIVEVISKHSGITEAEIRQAVEGRVKVKSAALRELHEDGRVTREGTGKKGDPYRYAIATECLSPASAIKAEQESVKTADVTEINEQILVPEINSAPRMLREKASPRDGAQGFPAGVRAAQRIGPAGLSGRERIEL